MATPLLEQLRELPPLDVSRLANEPSLAVSLLVPARHSGHALERTAREAHRYLSARFPGSFEIILIPNPPEPEFESKPGNPSDQSLAVAIRLAKEFPEIVVTPHGKPVGKGAGLRTGFERSRGKLIFFTDADLPYDLEFFTGASERLGGGYDLVTGNRRKEESYFDLPVSLLRIAYGRHRLGLLFNRVVRWLLPIRTIDTQAGIKAMSRRLASRAFELQRCPGFFFDLELFLAARGMGMHADELPVTLYLNSEKSTVRIFRESILASVWLSRIAFRARLGHYGRPPKARSIPKRFGKVPAGTRFFLSARWRLTPYARMAERLPRSGLILDLGCGHGLFALAAAIGHPSRKLLGIDHDAERIRLAREAGQDLDNLRFESGSMTSALENRAPDLAAVTLIDVMHYFEPEAQESLLKRAYQALPPGGRLLLREVDPEDGWISAWNRLYEKLATATGFTRSENEKLFFRSREGWTELLRKIGFQVRSERCSSAIFSDVLFVCERCERAPS